MRVVVAGSCVGVPGQAGATWAVLQYAFGLGRLGHDVALIEPVDDSAAVLAAHRRVVRQHGLAGRYTLVHPGRRTTGAPFGEVAAWMSRADIILNLSGILTDPELTGGIPVRVYVDLDPAFTQLWEAAGTDMGWAGHNRFVSVGAALATGACNVPTGGVEWIPTAPPVVLEEWPVAVHRPRHGFTTVANWRSYGPIRCGAASYGMKAHSARELIDLPRRAPGVRFEPALAIDSGDAGDVARLAGHGWRLLDAKEAAGTTLRYRTFIRSSAAEIGIAKSGYVLSRCGWFSDRSVCYLASGRPVLAQDTGWTAHYPAGEGLLAFSTVDEAAAGVEEIVGSYDRHAKAARAVAEDVFEARKVLRRLLDALRP